MSNVKGVITLSRDLSEDEYYYLQAFALNKRMQRKRSMLKLMIETGELEDNFRREVGLPLGKDGHWFVSNLGENFDEWDPSVFNKEAPPQRMPGPWCSWMPDPDNRRNLILTGKKPQHAAAWVSYLLKNLFNKHWGIQANGVITQSNNVKGKIKTDIVLVRGDKVISSTQGKKNVSPASQFK